MNGTDKNKKIKAEIRRLNQLFKDIDGKKVTLAARIIEKAAYLKVSLEELQTDIDEHGYYEKFKQGKDQEPYDRRRPAVDTFISMTAGYQKYMKQLSDLLPKEAVKDSGDEFEEFINNRKN